MGFWDTAQNAAAREFGRRHYRGIIWLQVAKRLLPALAVGAVAAGIVWALAKGWQWATVSAGHAAHAASGVHVSFGWAHALLPIVVVLLILAAVGGAIAWAARRWMWLIDGFLPLEHTGLWVAVIVGGVVLGAGGITWAVL